MTLAADRTAEAGFTYEALPMRVVFGAGRLAELPAEVDRLGLRRVLVLSTPGQSGLAARAADLLGGRTAGTFTQARMHVPTATARAARDAATAAGAQGCVAIGGGSTVGLGKAIALEFGLPVVTVPTTYAGSEMTTIWGLTEDGRKRTGRDPKVLPRSVIYDPLLTLGLPASVSGTSGLNAVAHAVEALYAPDASPVVSLMAEEGVRSLAAALPVIAENPSDVDARTLALRGAWLCGACLGSTTMSLHHKLCHVLGGTFDLPHAPTHATALPYVAAFNLPAAPHAAAALGLALGADDPARALAELGARVGAPTSLAAVGLGEDDIAVAVDQLFEQPYANPRPLLRDEVTALVTAAWRGSGTASVPGAG